MSLVFVYGTRPEAIKLSTVVEALRAAGAVPTLVATGQHTDLLRGTPAEDVMRPDVQCGIPGQADPMAYASLVEGHLRHRWVKDRPELVIVQGDTASAYAGALAAHALEIPVAHVEAGVRSGDETDPWPEERFRVGIDQMADMAFCATSENGQHLTRQSKWPRLMVVTGNPGIDALYAHTQPIQHPYDIHDRVLITLHRRESHGAPLQAIVDGLLHAAVRYPSLEFVWPTHPNPEVQKAIPEFRQLPPNIHILPPLPTVPFARMLASSRCVITDSGGVQEEGAALGVPCIIARDKTDRPESVSLGLASVAGRTPPGTLRSLDWALGFVARCTPSDCFGDGKAAPRIAEHLLNTVSIR